MARRNKPKSPEQVAAEVKAMLAEVTGRIGDGPEKPKLPSIAGKTDEGGLTAEMRALLARRAQTTR
jgi:hypothetical protein